MSSDDPYRDPDLYDLEYEGLNEDVEHYVKLASGSPGPVLELGCGTGRLTLELARAGVQVHGVDASPAMLKGLDRKLQAEPEELRARVTTEEGDFRALPTELRYPLVLLPFNTLHHCAHHRDVLATLNAIRAVLEPGGRLALDCYLPDPSIYARKRGERHEEQSFYDPRNGYLLRSWESGWYDDLEQVHHVIYTYRHPNGREEFSHIRFRMFYPQELKALLDWAGWDVIEEAQDFQGRPVGPGALKWVIQLQPRPTDA